MTADLETGGLHADMPVLSGKMLAIFLAGDPFGFTGELVRAIAWATEGERAKLRHVFPREVMAWELWHATAEPPTAGELAEMLAAEIKAATDDGDGRCAYFDGGMVILDADEDRPRLHSPEAEAP